MLQTTKTSNYDLWISQLTPPFLFTAPFDGKEFALLLLAAETQTSQEERVFICREIVRQGCRYAVCAGEQCERWHDMIDEEYVGGSPDHLPPDRLMMTTWHDDETLEDVLWYFRECATFDEFRPRRLLVLILGGGLKLGQEVTDRVSECFGAQL